MPTSLTTSLSFSALEIYHYNSRTNFLDTEGFCLSPTGKKTVHSLQHWQILPVEHRKPTSQNIGNVYKSAIYPSINGLKAKMGYKNKWLLSNSIWHVNDSTTSRKICFINQKGWDLKSFDFSSKPHWWQNKVKETKIWKKFMTHWTQLKSKHL